MNNPIPVYKQEFYYLIVNELDNLIENHFPGWKILGGLVGNKNIKRNICSGNFLYLINVDGKVSKSDMYLFKLEDEIPVEVYMNILGKNKILPLGRYLIDLAFN